jgi:hypothetical protein
MMIKLSTISAVLTLGVSALAMNHNPFQDLDPLNGQMIREATNAFCPLAEREIPEYIAKKALLEVLYPFQVKRVGRFTITRQYQVNQAGRFTITHCPPAPEKDGN